MSVYIKPCLACRRKAAASRKSARRRRKICDACKWIAVAPPVLGRKSLGTFSTKAQAEAAERKALTDHDKGIDLSSRTVTVSDLMERYLKHCEARNNAVEATTIHRYRSLSSNLITPHVGKLALAKLRAAHLSDWMETIRAGGGHKGKALSAKTVRHAVILLNGALKWAISMQLAATNPLSGIKIPRVARSKARALSADEIAQVVAEANKTRWGPFVVFAFATGMRRGEMLALDWSHVDTERCVVLVERSLTETNDGAQLKGTKTGASREVPLSRMALEALRRQHAMQAADRLRVGQRYRDGAAVFTDRFGQRIDPLSATKAYGVIAKAAAISSLRLHDARHSAATALLVAGVDVRTVSSILGHASPTTTLSTYAHLVVDAQREGIEKLGDRLTKIVEGNRKSR